MIKAIETRYAGCRFRSRLEARWAVFFDALDMPWQYEPEGFSLPSGPYLPDFYLPRSQTWVEIKGKIATSRERALARELCEASNRDVLIYEGDIPRGLPWFHAHFHPLKPEGFYSEVPALRDEVSRQIEAAFATARSARFEHGERG